MAFIQRVNGTVNSNAITITPNAAGDTFAGFAELSGSATVLTFADGGVNNTYGYAIYTPGGRQIALWWVLSCKAGATTVTVTADIGSVKFLTIDEYSGGYTAVQNSSGTFGNINSPGTGTDAITTGTFNQTSQPALVWGAVGDANQTLTALVAGTNFTLRGGAAGVASYSVALYTEDLTSSATGNIAATWTALSAGQFDHMYQGMLIFTQAPPVPWTRVGYGSWSNMFGAAVTPNIPAGNVGDLILLFSHEDIGSDQPPTVSGYTPLSTNTNDHQAQIWGRIATGSDSISVNWGAAAWTWAVVGRYRDGSGTTQMVVNASADNAAKTSNVVNFPPLTISTANSLVLAYGARNKTASTDGGSFSTMGSFSIASSNVPNGTHAAGVINEWIQTSATSLSATNQAYTAGDGSLDNRATIIALPALSRTPSCGGIFVIP